MPNQSISIISGRMISTNNSDETEFIGPTTDVLAFWTEARNIALDWGTHSEVPG
jgi:hypothetical protein